VYGIETQEVTVIKEKKIALTQCRRLLNQRFENKPEEMIEFIRWFWKREKSREDWRKINKPDSTFRADWRIVFSGKTVSDYELFKARSSNVF
jgi:ribosomal protein L32E